MPAPATNAPTMPPDCSTISGPVTARGSRGSPGSRTDRPGASPPPPRAAVRPAGSSRVSERRIRRDPDLDAERRECAPLVHRHLLRKHAHDADTRARRRPARARRPCSPPSPRRSSRPARVARGRSASSTIASAMRSLMLPPGLRCSHFTRTGTRLPAASRPSARVECRRCGRGCRSGRRSGSACLGEAATTRAATPAHGPASASASIGPRCSITTPPTAVPSEMPGDDRRAEPRERLGARPRHREPVDQPVGRGERRCDRDPGDQHAARTSRGARGEQRGQQRQPERARASRRTAAPGGAGPGASRSRRRRSASRTRSSRARTRPAHASRAPRRRPASHTSTTPNAPPSAGAREDHGAHARRAERAAARARAAACRCPVAACDGGVSANQSVPTNPNAPADEHRDGRRGHGGDPADQDRSEDERELLHPGLERERGLAQILLGQHARPQRTDAGADRRQRGAGRGGAARRARAPRSPASRTARRPRARSGRGR